MKFAPTLYQAETQDFDDMAIRFSPRSNKRAAVLVPIVPSEDGKLNVLLTLRSTTLNHHAGEVCLPGGKLEKGESDLDAALREASEECYCQHFCRSLV